MSAPFPALRPLQQLFWRLLAAPEGAARGADALRREGALASEDLTYLVRADPRMGAIERLDVYADMYFYRLRDCLAEDFPKLAGWIGAERFHNLVTDYLLAHPSTHFSLRELGRALPGFLGAHALARDHGAAPDLARLEWARVDVFDERDAEPLAREALLARGAAAPDSFALRLVPAARVLRIRAEALARWRGEAPDDADDDAAVDVLVWRAGFAVAHRSLPADEAACLAAIARAPLTLAALGEALAEAAPADAAATRLAAHLDTWTRDALLTEPV